MIIEQKGKKTFSEYLNAIRSRVIFFDGAMGTEIQKFNLEAFHFGGSQYAGCNDVLSIYSPQVIEKIHRSYLEVGADVIETNTFRSNPITLREYGLDRRCVEINLASVKLARRIADKFIHQGELRFVAGSMGPTGILLSLPDQKNPGLGFEEIRDAYQLQAGALLEGGVDLFLLETAQDILEVKAALLGIHNACLAAGIWRPVQAQVTLDTSGRMLAGTDISAVHAILDGGLLDVIGLNCSTGPEHMIEPLDVLTNRTTMPVSCLPNAGLPINLNGQAVYPLTPEDFAEKMAFFIEELGVNVVGGCCGTTPEHIQQLIARIGRHTPINRQVKRTQRLASAVRAVEMHQQPPPFLIGERLNTQGSRAFKQAMLTDDFETAVRLAEQQISTGAHGLDLCTALTERPDEVRLMATLVSVIAPLIDAALIIDSTDPAVMEAALKAAPGRCLLNSINLEDGGNRARTVLKLAKDHNAVVLGLTIDEKGMARTAERKLEIAQRIAALANEEFGISADRLVFDPLTFTIASGESEALSSAQETLRSIKLIKSHIPGALISLGISNVSYGLATPTRAFLNSVFLHLAVESGLDMAIVNPAQIRALADIPSDIQKLALDVLLNASEEALAKLIDHESAEQLINTNLMDDLPTMLDARLRERILKRRKNGLIDDITAYIKPGEAGSAERALLLLNDVLLPAMQEVGDRFGKGELILPFVLQAAEVMKMAADHLEKHLEKNAVAQRGRIILATVYGDIHDIGKNLVSTILSNNGFQVIDLGKQVPVEEIVQGAINQHADAIGLSALLVSTSQQMPLVVHALKSRGMEIPVLIGGAAVNADFAQRILKDKDGKRYAGGVYYCRDAFDALKALEKKPSLSPKNRNDAEFEKNSKNTMSGHAEELIEMETLVKYEPVPIPAPPFWGAQVIDPMPIENLFDLLDIKALYRLSWGARNARGMKWEKLSQDFNVRLNEMKASVLKNGWLQPHAVYDFWPVHTDGSMLFIHDPDTGEIAGSMHLPRKHGSPSHSLADYFSSQPDARDVAAFQVVTAGRLAGEYIRTLQANGDFTEAYFSHGLAVQITEAAADYVHALIRTQLGIPAGQGQRYSWGYPAIPDLTQHRLVFKLLNAHESLGLGLTSACQIIPEHSTAAIVVHHPKAIYF